MRLGTPAVGLRKGLGRLRSVSVTREQVVAVLFTLLMVLSMPAMASAGGLASLPTDRGVSESVGASGNDASGSMETTVSERASEQAGTLATDRVPSAAANETEESAPQAADELPEETVFSASSDSTVKAVDAATGEVIWTSADHAGSVTGVAVGPDEEAVYSVSPDGSTDAAELKALDAGTGNQQWRVELTVQWIDDVAVSPDGERVYTAQSDGTTRSYNASTGEEVWRTPESENGTTAVAAGPGGETVYVGTGSGTKTKALDAATGEQLWQTEVGFFIVDSIDVSPTGTTVYAAAWEELVALDATTGDRRWTAAVDASGVAVGPYGETVYSSHDAVRAFDADSGEQQWQAVPHERSARAIEAGPDGESLYTGSEDYTVKALDPDTGSTRWTMDDHDFYVRSLAVAGDFPGVEEPAPFVTDPERPTPGDPVRLAANVSGSDFQWTIDGEDAGEGEDVGYVFDDLGEYDVTLTYVDERGANVTESGTVEVVPALVGSVETAAGEPIVDAEIVVAPATDPAWFDPIADPDPVAENVTDADGNFSITELDPGVYRVAADLPEGSGTTQIRSDSFQQRFGQGEPIELSTESPLEAQREAVEDLEKASDVLIDFHTSEVSATYVDGYQTFNENEDVAGDVAPSSLSDLLGLSQAIIEDLVTEEASTNTLKSLGWKVVDHGLHRLLNGMLGDLDPENRRDLAESAEAIAGEEWLQDPEYTDEASEAYLEGFSQSSPYQNANDRLEDSGDEFNTTVNETEVDEEFRTDQVESIVERQSEWLRDERDLQGMVITPRGEVVYHSQSEYDRTGFKRSQRDLESADAAGDVFTWTGIAGSSIALIPGPGTIVGGVLSGVSFAGSRLTTLSELSAKARMAGHWSNQIIYWAEDVRTIPQVHEDTVEWLEDEAEEPTIHEVDGDIEGMHVAAHDYDAEVENPGAQRPQPILLCQSDDRVYWNDREMSVTVENTGNATANTRIVGTVMRYHVDEVESGDDIGDATTVVSAATDRAAGPTELDPGEAHTFDATFVPMQPLDEQFFDYEYFVRTEVWMNGIVVDEQYHEISPHNTVSDIQLMWDCQADSAADTPTSGTAGTVTAGDGIEGGASAGVADGSADMSVAGTGRAPARTPAPADVGTIAEHRPDRAFGAFAPNRTTLVETDLTPETTETSVEFSPDPSAKRLDLQLFAGDGADVSLEVVDPEGNVVGYDLGTGDSIEEIPNSTYSGPRQHVETVIIEDPPETLTVRAEARSFENARGQPLRVTATTVPERPALLTTNLARNGVGVTAGEGATTTVTLAELGNETGAENVTLDVDGTLPDGVDVRITDQSGDAVDPGGNLTATLSVDADENVQIDDNGRYPFTVTVDADTDETLDASGVLVLAEGADGLDVEAVGGGLERASFATADPPASGVPEGYDARQAYDADLAGNGSVTVAAQVPADPSRRTLFVVDEDGEWSALRTVERNGTVVGTVSRSGLSEVDQVVVAYDWPDETAYAGPDGRIDTASLRDAVDDWQRGDLRTGALETAIDVWASGEPVE